LVQRIWSNQSALAGHDPCVPIPAGEVYFNAAPVLEDTFEGQVPGVSFKTKSVKIAAGQSRTIEVDLFSDAQPSAPWNVTAQEVPLFGNGPLLSFEWDQQTCATAEQGGCSTSGSNGDKRRLKISVAAGAGAGFPASSFVLASVDGQKRAN